MFWVGVAVIVVGLLASIAWHELGHLLPAKRFGVLVTQYMIGFGPSLLSRRRGETEYGLKAIPLGGYIRMVGMFPSEAMLPAGTAARRDPARATGWRRRTRSIAAEAREFSGLEVPAGQEGRTFAALTVPRKLVIMAGGPFANLVLAFVLLAVANIGIGLPAATTSLGAVSTCLPAAGAAECTDADAPSPALAAGLEVGDVIVSWNGVPASDWPTVQAAIRDGGSGPVDVVVDRGGAEVALEVTPSIVEREVLGADGEVTTAPIPVVGITPVEVLERQSLGEVGQTFVAGVGETFRIVVTLPVQLVGVVSSTFGDAEREPGVVGLIGVGRIAGEATSLDTDFGAAGSALTLLQVLSSLNLALFAFNMIPLLPLDGGHIAGALWEGLRRRIARLRGRPDPGPVDVARLLPLTYVVVIALAAMFVLLTVADIVDPLSLA
ncbi:zinc metalloprotease [Serinibacter arcticus]|uniref:Zinc metalloprotease n=1 Tax=Serinibacter arcticus TaxID=1655435 RepID=A0A2U1ZSW8_9MICO|nr:site-2 protease family protein [Serinibacter arcticus]PWD50078.1 zinc metalloprotease [Serinibacter arcticus]